jgi:AcrR family transcriptional regulator
MLEIGKRECMDLGQIQSGEKVEAKADVRRQPQQIRGQQRVTVILDAAEQLFSEIGYQATTTNAIAARAHTSIGSLYQFFPHKKAILQAVVDRYYQQFHELIQTILTDDFFFQPLSTAFDSFINALITLHATHGGTHIFFIDSNTSCELAPEAQMIHQELLSRLEQLLAARAPHLSNTQCTITSLILYKVTHTMLELSETVTATEHTMVLAGLKTMLIAYLTPLLESEA